MFTPLMSNTPENGRVPGLRPTHICQRYTSGRFPAGSVWDTGGRKGRYSLKAGSREILEACRRAKKGKSGNGGTGIDEQTIPKSQKRRKGLTFPYPQSTIKEGWITYCSALLRLFRPFLGRFHAGNLA